MQLNSPKIFDHPVKIMLVFATILFLAFLPLSSFLFYLKNDAFLNYFPPKFFMSESLKAGHLPLWNPYINYGIPQYADMNAGYWSPLTWLISGTIGYNAYTFTIELLLYLLAGAAGMYSLSGLWVENKFVKAVAGIAFMCCGYHVGHLQHFNWISGAAFLPWCIWSYNMMLEKSFTSKSLIVSALCFYLFLASAHPGLIIGAIYFFIAFFVYAFLLYCKKNELKRSSLRLITGHALFIGLLICFSAGILAGYTDVLPYFLRGDKLSLAQSLSHPTTFISWISTVVPLATVKNHGLFNTDISMRNCYFSITLLTFFIIALFRKKSGWQRFLLITGLLFALLSSGGFFKSVAYDTLPMIGFVRLNGEFRIFALICFILLAAIELDKFLQGKSSSRQNLQKILLTFGIAILLLVLFGLYKAWHSGEGILYLSDHLVSQNSFSSAMKVIVDRLSFYDTFWLHGIVQMITLYFIWRALRSSKHFLLFAITAVNLIVSTLLHVPFTGAGQASVRDVQNVIAKSPPGMPIPLLNPILQNDSLPTTEQKLIGDWNFYNKQIGNLAEYPYPIVLKNMRKRYEDSTEMSLSVKESFVYTIPGSGPGHIKVSAFSPNGLTLLASSESGGRLVLQQNYYPHWKYQNGNKTGVVQNHENGFMSVPLQPGLNHIEISFQPKLVLWAMLFSLLSLVVALVFVGYKKFR